MGSKTRGYDESKSPQWKYLLRNESRARRTIEADLRRERARAAGTEEERNGERGKPLTKKEKRERRRKLYKINKEPRYSKKGKLIVYTATPDDEAPRESWSSATGKEKTSASASSWKNNDKEERSGKLG
jgi:hypothetical protein